MKLKLQLATLALTAISFSCFAQFSNNEGAARLWIQSHAKDLKIWSLKEYWISEKIGYYL